MTTVRNRSVNTQSLVMYMGISCPNRTISGSAILRECAGCGRAFVPAGAQKYCAHTCYSATLSSPIEQRFWSKVNKTHSSGCWLWMANAVRGYGQFVLPRVEGQQRHVYAHRYAWELSHGSIPDGQFVLHACDVPLCCNPAHLFLGTQQDNLTDARQKGRLDARRPRTTTSFTPAERLTIFNLRGYRGICVDLARRHGVSKACITAIRKGRFKRPSHPFERVPSVPLEIRGEVA